jgi:hypothetical protein
MPITAAFIGGAVGLLGSSMQGDSAEAAAQTQATGQAEAARIAAAESRFRPVGITTRFGSSGFEYGIPGVTAPVRASFATPEEFAAAQTAYQTRLANEGRVTGAKYTLDPGLKANQDRLLKLVDSGLLTAEQAEAEFGALTTGARGLFSLGNQYLAQSPEQAAAQYMAGQQNLLAPGREREMAQLQNRLFQTGRGGLSVGATGTRPSGAAGLGAASPELEAYYNAIAQQDAQLAAQATQGGMDQTRFGAGLLGTGGNLLTQGYGGRAAALGPYQAFLSGATGLETLGQDPLNLGSALGGRIANPQGGQALLTGGMAAAGTSAAANAYNPFATALTSASRNPAFQQGVSNLFGAGGAVNQFMYPAGNPLQTGQYADPGFWT